MIFWVHLKATFPPAIQPIFKRPLKALAKMAPGQKVAAVDKQKHPFTQHRAINNKSRHTQSEQSQITRGRNALCVSARAPLVYSSAIIKNDNQAASVAALCRARL